MRAVLRASATPGKCSSRNREFAAACGIGTAFDTETQRRRDRMRRQATTSHCGVALFLSVLGRDSA